MPTPPPKRLAASSPAPTPHVRADEAADAADAADPLASRAGYKLLAAVEQFGLAPLIAGAHAIDLGICTGGFTDCLLRFGAAHVTGIDVGPNQLRPHLRDDPRVLMIEKAHFKKLPLHVAPGPFGFFVVDVSHVAARSMMRGLSKRLQVGAHGFVLLKPQFELPSTLVPRGGAVQSRNLRKLALNRFKKKAAQHGFALLDRADSPVAGGSGTIEILLHLRFEGAPVADDEAGEVATLGVSDATSISAPKPTPARDASRRAAPSCPRPSKPSKPSKG